IADVSGREPELVVATGVAHLNGLADMAYITLYFPKNIIAHINVNWLSPVKMRTTLVGGERKMLVWNDLEPSEKVKVYDKGVQITEAHDESRQRLKDLIEAKVFEVGSGPAIHDLLVSYRSGDMCAPRVAQTDALQPEAGDSLDCAASGTRARHQSDGGGRPHVLSEDLFRGVLLRERRRSDRSDQPVLLLLLGAHDGRGAGPSSMWEAAIAALAAVMHETDVLGWLEWQTVIGVIVPAIRASDVAGACEGLAARVRRALAKRLDSETVGRLSI